MKGKVVIILWLFCLFYGIFVGAYFDKLNLNFIIDFLVSSILTYTMGYGA